jgi:hypothetical protein
MIVWRGADQRAHMKESEVMSKNDPTVKKSLTENTVAPW